MSGTQDIKFPKELIQTIVKIGNGTGFLFDFPFDSPNTFFVASNKHVLTNFSKHKSIKHSCPPNEYYRRSLCPFSNEVYFHPDGNIDLACVVAYQSIHIGEPGSPERFPLCPLTSDHFIEPQTPISSNSKLTVVGYPMDKSSIFEPLIQEEQLVCDINLKDYLKDHHLAIKPSLAEGASGSPVFIESDGQFFVLGVVEARNDKLGVSIIIKQRYVSELLDYATERFKQHHGTTPVLPKKKIFVK